MKRIIITGALVLSLASISPTRAQTRSNPEPQVFTCIMTWVALGLFAACVIACYAHSWNPDYSGPTNAPPIVPVPPDDDPPDDPPVTNIPPDITVDATAQTEHLDARVYHWLDSSSNEVTDVYHTTIQTASSPSGPWTNAYVVTLWESAYGDTMVVDGLFTNYTRRAPNGSVTNRAPLELTHSEPSKFYRAKP